MDFSPQTKLPGVVAVPIKANSISPLMEHLTQAQKQFISVPPSGLVPLVGNPFPFSPMLSMKVNSLVSPTMPLQPGQLVGMAPISPQVFAALQQQSRAPYLQTPLLPVSNSPSIAQSPSSASPVSLDADEKSLDDDMTPSAAQDESSVTADESSVSQSLHSSLTIHTSASSSSSEEEECKPDKLYSEAEYDMAQFLSSLAAALPPRDDIRKRTKKTYKVNLSKPDFDFAMKKRMVSKTGRPKESHVCPNCSVTESTLWRNCNVNGKSLYFCNACGLRFKKGKYCGLCYKVYYDADTNHRDWKQCCYCLNWSHKACLQEHGHAGACDEATPYACTACSSRDF